MAQTGLSRSLSPPRAAEKGGEKSFSFSLETGEPAWEEKDRVAEFHGVKLAVEKKLAAMDAHCRACASEIEAGGFDVLFANSCQFFRATSIGQNRLRGL